MGHGKKLFIFLLCVFMLPAEEAAAEDYYTSTLLGPLGLNTMPSARMDKAGTISAGVSTLDPYVHGYLGIQIADPLYLNIRQSALVSNINEEAERLYPGVDLKLRLAKETGTTPEVAIGLQNAIGHKRMAGEYLAFSKRYRDFDFTLGLGWGRFANKGHITNPFKIFGSHFDKERGIDQEMPNEPGDWFTGDKIGFFGGVEYFTKIDGLSLKADWGADRYEMEQAAFDYNAPAPWSVGAVYRPFSWMDVALAVQGTDKIMGRLSFHGNMEKWPWTNKVKDNEDAVPMRAYRTGLALPSQMELSAERETMLLYETAADIHSARAMLDLDPSLSAPAQYGRAVKHISNHGGPEIEEISLTPTIMNLRGPSVRLLRRDFEQALAKKQGSPQEAWRNAGFSVAGEKRPIFGTPMAKRVFETEILLDNEIGLSEEDSGLLHRNSLIVETKMPRFLSAFTTAAAFRLNLKDNLRNLDKMRLRPLLPVRSDVDDFTKDRFGLDRAYVAWTHSINPELHVAASGGYLEEMYSGFGGEILYRPFGPRFALGADLWQVFKRDPESTLHLGNTYDHLATGHINAWYDIPEIDVTAEARIGRYLAADIGGTLALQKNFKNGASLEGFITVTDQADFDLFGGTTHAYHGVRLAMPLGRIVNSQRIQAKARLTAAPFGRDTGQSLDKPLNLYELTQLFSYAHIAQNWNDVMEPPLEEKKEVYGPKKTAPF